jgi:hypothetical protein
MIIRLTYKMTVFFCDCSKCKEWRSAKRFCETKAQGMGQWECNPRWYRCKFVSKELHESWESYTSAECGGPYAGSNKIEDSGDDEEDVMVVEHPNLRTPVVATGLYFDKGDSFDLDSLDNQSCSVIDDDGSEDSSDDDDIPRPRNKSKLTSFEQNIHLTPATVNNNRG